jgi:hypothetical protein
MPGQTMTRRAWMESWWAAAAAAVALLGGGLFARDTVRRSRLATLAAGAAGDHQNCAIKFNLAERPISLEEAARRYDPAYASLSTLDPLVGLGGGPADILDRHSCVFEGRRFAHVVFRYKDRIVSLLVTNGPVVSSETPALARKRVLVFSFTLLTAAIAAAPASAGSTTLVVTSSNSPLGNHLLVYDSSGALIQTAPTNGLGGVSGNAGGVAGSLQSFHRYTPGTNCRAWLMTILQHVRSNRRRAQGRTPAGPAC